MIIDIEHYLKIRILNTIEKIEEEDGYKIVNLYLEQDYNNKDYPQKIHESIRKKLVMNTIEIYFRNIILQNKK